ncbi:hypothetical protein UPYG_G00170140 [Umbra pygmaea]|uniref:Uncharacterized protein n=1 Tax=Umbra pygmaea TaxID=75934 RepID=A0ABD0WNG9_UMBPY
MEKSTDTDSTPQEPTLDDKQRDEDEGFTGGAEEQSYQEKKSRFPRPFQSGKPAKLDCKTTIPLPLLCMIEEETLHILQNAGKEYTHTLGTSHPLTNELHEHIDMLKCHVSSKLEYSEPGPVGLLITLDGLLSTLVGWVRSLFALVAGCRASVAIDITNKVYSLDEANTT